MLFQRQEHFLPSGCNIKMVLSYFGFKVLFDSDAHLKRNIVYRIEALISGPRSGRGDGGLSTVVWSGVTFAVRMSS